MNIIEFLTEHLFREQENGSWWNQGTSEFVTAETIKLLQKMLDNSKTSVRQ